MSVVEVADSMPKRLRVVTTTFRSAPYIETYCAGVVTWANLDEIEVCLVMNEPDSLESRVVAEYSDRHPGVFQVIEVARESIAASTNRGILSARTPYIGFVDVDDMRAPDSFARQMAVLDSDPSVDVVYGDFMIVQAQGSTDGALVRTPEFSQHEFSRSCICSLTKTMRSSLLEWVGGYDEQFLSGGDFEFQVRAALASRFARCPGLHAYYTRYADSGSASSGRLQPLERTVVELRYGLYDKTRELKGYQYVDEARQYRLDEVLISGVWHGIEEYVPRYAEVLESRAAELEKLERRLAMWRRTVPLRSCLQALVPVRARRLARAMARVAIAPSRGRQTPKG